MPNILQLNWNNFLFYFYFLFIFFNGCIEGIEPVPVVIEPLNYKYKCKNVTVVFQIVRKRSETGSPARSPGTGGTLAVTSQSKDGPGVTALSSADGEQREEDLGSEGVLVEGGLGWMDASSYEEQFLHPTMPNLAR